jgi:hypothetical protein
MSTASRYYAINAYGYSGFPKFWDNYKTLTQARAAAKQALADGYRMVEILRDLPSKPSYFGIERETIETLEN